MKNLLFMIAVAIAISGCTVSAKAPNRVILKEDEIIIDGGKNNKGYHCPPGQAKKGNC